MTEVRELVQNLIYQFDNEASFIILLSSSLIPHLEEPINRARFFNYDKKLELYFDSKDINRFSRLKKLVEIISKRIKTSNVKSFEKYLKVLYENEVLHKEKEGPSDGMAWKGFGGVHSHYNLSPLGKALLIFHTQYRCNPLKFEQINMKDDWDQVINSEMNMIIRSVVERKLRVKNSFDCFSSRRPETSYVAQRLFELVASSQTKIYIKDLQDYIWDKVGEIHIGEISSALKNLKPLIQESNSRLILTNLGENILLGYANIIVESALLLKETELVHYMINANSIINGAKSIIYHYCNWF